MVHHPAWFTLHPGALALAYTGRGWGSSKYGIYTLAWGKPTNEGPYLLRAEFRAAHRARLDWLRTAIASRTPCSHF